MILRIERSITMGDRAVISNKSKKIGVYLHWYGYREFVESVLAYCDVKKYRSPDVDDEYGWARLCQVAGNTIGGNLSVGVGIFNRMDTDNWDNGTYIIKDWDIVDRLFTHSKDEKMKDTMFENLKYINNKQPKDEQLKEEELEAFAKLWEIRHLDRLNDERKVEVEKIIKEEIEKQKNNQEKEQTKKEDIINVEEQEEIKGVVEEFDLDVQKPTENDLKEKNKEYEVIDKKGDDSFAR